MGSSVVALLGAGVSIEAGLLGMLDLVGSFEATLTDPELLQAWQFIRTALETHVRSGRSFRQVDIELLLESLEALEFRDENPLAAFVAENGWLSIPGDVASAAPSLRRLLYEHIRSVLDIEVGKVGYFRGFVDFAVEMRGLDVYTLNYDVLVEVCCDLAGLQYTDGFDTHWNPSLLDDAGRYHVRLHKLHGSLLWYATGGNGSFTKIPLKPGTFPADGAHYSGRRLTQVMIYPGPGKALYASPYAELLERFRQSLRQATLLVVMGCSLRDAHVRRAILEAAEANPAMRIAVVDPRASELLEGSDSLFRDGMSFSSLRRRLLVRSQRTGHALATRTLLDLVSGCNLMDETEGDVARARRVGGRQAQASALWQLMYQGVTGGHWGVVAEMTRDHSDASVAGLTNIITNGDPHDTRWLLAVALVVGHSSSILSEAARTRVIAIMRNLGEGAVHGPRESVIVRAEGVDVADVVPKGADAMDVYARRAATLQLKQGELETLLGDARYFLGPDQVASAEQLIRQVAAMADYFADASLRTELVGFDGGRFLPLATAEVRERLVAALPRGVGVLD